MSKLGFCLRWSGKAGLDVKVTSEYCIIGGKSLPQAGSPQDELLMMQCHSLLHHLHCT